MSSLSKDEMRMFEQIEPAVSWSSVPPPISQKHIDIIEDSNETALTIQFHTYLL